jgi:hypothetical protein
MEEHEERITRLSQIDLNPSQRAAVLEWFAFRVWVGAQEGTGCREYHSKSYDPLTIDLRTDGGGTAHSYVFDFHDGGRHHHFDSLDNLEDWLFEELIGEFEWAGRWALESNQESEAE